MNSRNWNIAGLSLALIISSAVPAKAFPVFGSKKPKDANNGKKLTPAQSALIDKAILREKEVIKVVREREPLVETYIQNMKPDPVMRQIPDSDEHFLGRVNFKKVIGDDPYKAGPKAAGPAKGGSKLGFLKGSGGFLGGLTGHLHLAETFHQDGFVSMLLMDSYEFDKVHYNFGFVRNDFLGNVPTAVFDVTPAKNNDHGRFFGRIWVETRNGNVVRFDGDFAGSDKDYQDYFHFDSWRTNIQPDLWLPTTFYVEESDPKSRTSTLKFKAINHVWGYSLKVPPPTAESTSMEVVGANDVSNDAQDVSPLGAQRAFVKQAEDNVIERLYTAGLLDAPSDFDKTLEALANNILAYNNIPVAGTIHVRTLLTEPLESLAVGNTIILSKSLIDTTSIQSTDGAQQEGNLYAILAFQLAHIITGHRLDTKYAFNDRLLFPDDAAFKRIPMHHTPEDNIEAAKKTVELLSVKELQGGSKYFGLYLQQLQQRVKGLKALNEPVIGDGLVKSDTDSTLWLAELIPKSEKLDVKDLKQQAAEPLSNFLRFDPWTDQVITMHTALEPILSASDKMPFEAAPIYLKLSYYKAPAPPVDPGPAQPAPAGVVPAGSVPAGTVPGDAVAPSATPPVNTTTPATAPATAPGTPPAGPPPAR